VHTELSSVVLRLEGTELSNAPGTIRRNKTAMMYTNIWYVAERQENLKNTPLPVRMLGRDFVLFRDQDGNAACLSNVCPHRGASLAQGQCRDEGGVACPFHAWHFDRDGNCTKIPSQKDPTGDIPPEAKIDAYPTQEKYGYIWVFLGDDLDAATPIFDMPEYDNPEWRAVTHSVVFNANQHWTKMADMDHVHLPIVHGIGFGGENPIRPPDHTVVYRDDGGYEVEIRGKPDITKGEWKKLRSDRTEVTSKLKYFIPGFTSRGKTLIGGPGSGHYNCWYQMMTPIDDETTQLHFTFHRSFMTEPENDAEHLKRNLRNVYQDKDIAEAIMPKRTPDVADWPPVRAELEDKMMDAYWQVLQQFRAKGWQIDRVQMEALDLRGEYRVIPSPARKQNPNDWVFDVVPRIAPGQSAGKPKQSEAA